MKSIDKIIFDKSLDKSKQEKNDLSSSKYPMPNYVPNHTL